MNHFRGRGSGRRTRRSASPMTATWVALGALAALPGVAHAQASRPASGPVQPDEVRAQLTLIFELDEHHLKVQEMWQLENPTTGSVPAADLEFPLGTSVRRFKLDEDVEGFAANAEGSLVRATRDMGPGSGGFAGNYLLDFDGNEAIIERTLPVPVAAARIILEDFDGLEVDGSTQFSRRLRDLNGLTFQVYDFGGLEAGHRFRARIGGIPTRTTLPRDIALVLSIAAFGWMIVQVARRRPNLQTSPVLGALSAEARREQLLRALELLEEDRISGRIEGRKHDRRRKALMQELADVLREIDIVRRSRTT